MGCPELKLKRNGADQRSGHLYDVTPDVFLHYTVLLAVVQKVAVVPLQRTLSVALVKIQYY